MTSYICYAKLSYAEDMAVVTFRADEETLRALAALEQATGESRSRVVRDAVLLAEREARRAALRSESARLRDDPVDRAEARAILEDMGGADAW